MNMNLNLKNLLNEKSSDDLQDELQKLSIKQNSTHNEDPNARVVKTEEKECESSIKINVYGKYFKASGSCCFPFTVLCFFLSAQFFASFSDYILAYWANMDHMDNTIEKYSYSLTSNSSYPNNIDNVEFKPISESTENESYLIIIIKQNLTMIIYSASCILLVILTLIRSALFYNMIKNISLKLFSDMFSSILRATMRFFLVTGDGKILNRFSNDIGIIDEQLPTVMMKSTQILLSSTGTAFTIMYVNLWFLIPIALLMVTVLLLRTIYLRASRAITRLERTTRSPVYGHVNATLQGLSTIRAFGREKTLEKEFDNYQDLHGSALHTFISTTRAFGFWIDIVCVIFTAAIVLSYLIFKTDALVGDVGLAITQAISLSCIFQWGIRMSADMDNQMTSVERIVEYNTIEHEADPSQSELLPENWPQHGKIEFRKVYLNYSPNDPPVLYNINIVINPEEKIGIVGRTGAGKSSLINAIFQLSNIDGSILIDNVDITKITLAQLRSKISIIPQQPVLFSGTLRQNLDPFSKYSDTNIWAALEEVELTDYIKNLNGSLDFHVSEGGTNFSTGQRQLLCLARAILCRNDILILDEATANVDQQTDMLIQKTLRKNFVKCTVLTIAHRLNTIIDSDRVLVMDMGRVVEFDHAYILLQNKLGYFSEMVTRLSNNRELYNRAKESYQMLNKDR